MKEQKTKRKLFERSTRIAENAENTIEIADNLANSLEKYIAGAEHFASSILKKANIDVILKPSGLVPQLEAVDRNTVSVEVDQALDVLLYCRTARNELDATASRNAMWKGVMLAQSIEHLNANIAWHGPVEERREKVLRLKKYNQPSVTDNQIIDAVNGSPTKKAAAECLGITPRQLRRRLKNIGRT